MNLRRDNNAGSRAAVSAAALLGMASVALFGAGCNQPAHESAAPLSTNTTVVVPAARDARVVSSRELPGAGGDATAAVTDTNAGPGGAAGTSDVIAGRIDAAIIHDTQMTGSRVAAVVDSAGVATLNGTVQNAQQKALAEKAAKDTPGVVSLKDKLEIRPTGGAGVAAAQSAQMGQSSRRMTSLTVGDGGTGAANASSTGGNGRAATGGVSSQTPRVVVVNNYVPVPSPQRQNAEGSDDSPGGVYNGGYADGASAASSNGYYDSYGSYGNPAYGYGSSYGYANGYNNAPNGPNGVLNSGVVPDYLRDMSNANDYANYARDSGQY